MLLNVRSIILLVALFFAASSVYLVSKQWRFEHFLSTLSLTFDDFGKEYTDSLIDAEAHGSHIPSVKYPIVNSTLTIPPRIHYIWFKNLYHDHLDVSTIPTEGSNAPALCRQFNPDFDIHIWSTEEARELLETHYSWFIPIYDSYEYPIQRVDAFKYFVLYHYGGVYIDMDMSCRRSLAPLLDYPAWFPKASPLGVNNDLMATRARHPLLEQMIHNLEARKWNLLFPYVTIYYSTGPQFTSDNLKSWWNSQTSSLYQAGNSKKDSDKADWFYVLPQVFYSDAYSFFGHRPGGTWHGGDVAFILWFVEKPYARWASIIVVAGGLVAVILRKTRFRLFRGRFKYGRIREDRDM